MKLGNPKNTIEVIQKYDFDFQKKFGQNFLIDERVLEKIISAAEVNKDDFVLEIRHNLHWFPTIFLFYDLCNIDFQNICIQNGHVIICT